MPNNPQHYRPEYLAGQINAIVIAIAQAARLAGIHCELNDVLGRLAEVTEKNLESSPSKDYYTGSLHAVQRIRSEI